MSPFIEESAEVFYSGARLPLIGAADIAFLKQRAAGNERRRSRLCLHASPADDFHEMLIVHHRDAYVRPHRHAAKCESLTVIEGRATLLTYDDDGAVLGLEHLGLDAAAGALHYRMPPLIWHGLVIESQWFVFLETTPGPFDRGTTNFPGWAPDGTDPRAGVQYMRRAAGAAAAARTAHPTQEHQR